MQAGGEHLITPDDFLQIVKNMTDKAEGVKLVYGTADPAYATGRPKVLIDGESTMSNRTYPYLASYTPAANDRVAILIGKNSGLIIGKVV